MPLRPLTDAERPILRAAGAHLRSLREAAGLTRQELASKAQVSASHVKGLEFGDRRSRPSTLARLAFVLGAAGAGDADELLRGLLEVNRGAMGHERSGTARAVEAWEQTLAAVSG